MRRPTEAELGVAIDKLRTGVPEELYHHVWTLIYEIDALREEVGKCPEN
ncbi:hypothetical protein P4T89_12480 [Bacillus nakamurai]|nr:hypothetical protein [Bacillus nakamurai]MED1228337.1 hypothetical protein [Bacillus nakamurai]